MSQEERTQLIREIKELLQMQEVSRTIQPALMFNDETIKLMKDVLQKCLKLSL